MQTINLTPTWSNVADIIILAIEHGTEEGKKMAKDELKKMAKVADLYVESLGDSSPDQFTGLMPTEGIEQG